GARVSPVGTALDPDGITISTGTCRGDPVLAFDGANYLAVWEDFRSGPADIYGARLSPFGTVLDPEGIPVSTAADHQQYPALAFDGTNYLAGWEDRRSQAGDPDIYGARARPAAAVP